MTTLDQLRHICLSLPTSVEGDNKGQIGYSVPVKGRQRGYAWSWMEKTDPKKAKTPNLRVLAVRVPSMTAKELLLSSDSESFFTEPHYNGFPAILVRLDVIEPEDLRELLVEAWRTLVPKEVAAQYELEEDAKTGL